MSTAERELTAATLEALRAFAQTHSEFMARLGGLVFNDILEQWSGVFPAEGFITRSYSVAAGAIRYQGIPVSPTATITVSTSGNNGAIPTGTGTYKMLANQVGTIPLASREFTIWGTPGDVVSFTVFTKGVDPSS